MQELILILKIIIQCAVKHIFNFTDKNNNASFEDLDIHCRTCAYVRLDLQNCRISIFHLMWFQNITEVNCLF